MIHERIDETRVGHGIGRNEGFGCSGKGAPDKASPFVKMEKGRNNPPVPMDKTSPLAKMGQSEESEVHPPHLGLDSKGSMVFRF